MSDETTVTISERLWSEVVEQYDPDRWKRRDPSYEFSNGRKFEDPKDQQVVIERDSVRSWLLFKAPWIPLLRLMAAPYNWLCRRQMEYIFKDIDEANDCRTDS